MWSSCGGLEHIDDLIKRVVASGAIAVDIHDGKLFVNGTEQPEAVPRARHGDRAATPGYACSPMSYTVPEGRRLRDGRQPRRLQDGRCFGPIPNSSVVGRAFVRIWPLGRIGLL